MKRIIIHIDRQVAAIAPQMVDRSFIPLCIVKDYDN